MIRALFFIVGLAFLSSSCIVTKKKYDELLAQKVKTDGDLSERTAQLEKTEAELKELESRIAQLKADTTSIGVDLRTNQQKLAGLEKEHEELNTYYKNLLNSSGKLNRDLAMQQEQLDRTRRVNDSLSSSLEEREKKVAELESVLANKDKAVSDLKNRISNALLGFKESDLTVEVKNGKVYVSLAEQLLFGSGSITVDKKGVTALQQLAKALKDQNDINITVEGHTDNVPISKKSQYMNDNWDLSVMRATSITRILISAGLSPKQVTAAGRGEYVPLALNDSPGNKAKNRRTEIVVTPNLDELFKLLEGK
jgi:chemotaxis protein MotB